MADYSTFADCLARLKLSTASADDQAMLKGFAATATAMMTEFMNRDPRLADYEEKYSGRDSNVLPLRNFPIAEITSVVVAGRSVPIEQFTCDDYVLEWTQGRFPRGRGNVVVAYSAGYDPAPKVLREAHLLAVTALWINKDTNPNATGESFAGVSSEQWQQAGSGYLPVACRSMIQPLVAVALVG